MKNTTINVVRSNFWYSPNEKTQGFIEHSTEKPHENRDVCNCTRHVTIRPAGTPDEVHQEITVIGEHDLMNSEFRLGSKWSVFRWGDKHAYFMFRPDGINIEISLPGYGSVGCFFSHLFLGNRVDISKLMNGHSPSRIVDLSSMSPDDLWVHDCNWGNEAVRIFPESDETSEWRARLATAERITSNTKKYVADLTSGVHDVRAAVEQDTFLDEVRFLQERLARVVGSLRDTTMFRLSDEVRLESRTQR